MKHKSPIQLSIHKIFWVLGISFLLVCSTFGAISKLFFSSSNGLEISPFIQFGLGLVQLVSTVFLLQDQRRRWGIAICCAFLVFALWWGREYASGLLFSFFGCCVCLYVWNQPKDTPTVPIQEEDSRSVSLKIDGEISVTEGTREANVDTPQRKELWMESANEKDIMDWLHEEDG